MSNPPKRKNGEEFAFEKGDATTHVTANTLSGYAKTLLQALLFLILTPFLIDHLGADEFGLWSLVWAAVSLLGLVNLGFGAAVAKFIAEARGRGDRDAYRRSLSTLFWTHVVEMGLLLIVVALGALLAREIFDVPADQLARARRLLVVLGVAAAVNLPLTVFRGVFAGHQEWRISNYYEIFGSVAYFVGTLLILPHFPQVTVLAIINAVSVFLGLLFNAVHAFRALPGVRLSLAPRYASAAKLREIWGVSAYFAVIAVAMFIATRVDTLVIQWWLDLRAIAIYAIAARVAHNVLLFGAQLAATLSPVVAELHGADDKEKLRLVWIRGSKFTIAIAAPVIVTLIVLAKPLIVTWLSEEWAPAALVMQLLLVATLIDLVHSNSHNFMSMRGEQRTLAGGVVGSQVVNLGLSILFVGPFGLVGVAAATVASSLASNVGYVMHWVTKQQKTTRWAFYRQTLEPAVLPLLMMALVTLGIQRVFTITHLVEVAFIALIAVFVFWITYWPFGLKADERTVIADKLVSRFRRWSH